jgi:preprotein translocase subunit SecG
MIWESLLLGLHVVVAAALIGFVLLQHGKGADMGAAFGSGSSGSLFGAAGSANFLSRSTAVLATVFFLSSLGLTYLASNRVAAGSGDVMKQGVMQSAPTAPATTSTTPKAAEPATKATEVPGTAPASQPAAAPATPAAAKDASSKAADVPK